MREPQSIQLVIADDHQLFLEGLQQLLRDAPVQIVGTATNGRELLDLLQQQPADVVLLDISMPVLGGLSAAREIRKQFPGVKLIFLSSYLEQYLIDKAKAAGASAYLLKTCSKEELLSTLRRVMIGGTSFPDEKKLRTTQGTEKEIFFKQFNITRREMEILYLIREGLSSQQIADKLFLSVLTVDTHRKHIMQKLDINKTASLVDFLARHQL